MNEKDRIYDADFRYNHEALIIEGKTVVRAGEAGIGVLDDDMVMDTFRPRDLSETIEVFNITDSLSGPEVFPTKSIQEHREMAQAMEGDLRDDIRELPILLNVNGDHIPHMPFYIGAIDTTVLMPLRPIPTQAKGGEIKMTDRKPSISAEEAWRKTYRPDPSIMPVDLAKAGVIVPVQYVEREWGEEATRPYAEWHVAAVRQQRENRFGPPLAFEVFTQQNMSTVDSEQDRKGTVNPMGEAVPPTPGVRPNAVDIGIAAVRAELGQIKARREAPSVILPKSQPQS